MNQRWNRCCNLLSFFLKKEANTDEVILKVEKGQQKITGHE